MGFKGLIVAAIMTCLLGGCGGGGGGGGGYSSGSSSGSTVTVSFNPTSISTTYSKSGGTAAGVTVTASVGNPPSTTVYAYIVADSTVFAPGPQPITRNADGTYSATLSFNASASAGTYSGVLTLELCKDSGCSSMYTVSGATLPYNVTVTP